MNKTVSYEVQNDIITLIIDNPPVNVITADVREGLRQALETLASLEGAKALVITCAGKTFLSGADINEFNGPPKEEEFHQLFALIEQFPLPVVAALKGTVMGGGLELALACHYRVAQADTRLCFPELTLGIFPGAGGTQRLPRLIGLEQALDMITSCKMIDAITAADKGLVDEVAAGTVEQASQMSARQLAVGAATPRTTSQLVVEDADSSQAVLARFTEQVTKQYPHRQSPLLALRAIEGAITLPFDQGIAQETTLVNQAKVTPEAKALIHLFFAERQTGKIPGLTSDIKPRAVNKGMVIGAGTMGRGIAMCFANAGIPVVLVDSGQEALDKAREFIDGLYESRIKRGRMTAAQKAATMDCITYATSMAAGADADILIEAVYENLALKQDIFSKLDAIAKPGAILATNTSTLDINLLADVTARPEAVLGLHFFSPANVMPLLEVVRTGKTADQTLVTALALAKPLRKTPVVSGVCYGFIGNRMMEGYAREAERLTLEGATPAFVDSALEDFGMAMGILKVFDMAGVDVGVKVRQANPGQYPPDPTYYQASQALFEHGRLGQKTAAGFYRYSPGSRVAEEDPVALEILRERARQLGIARRENISREEVVERCLYPLLNEGLKILEEGIALRPGDVDVVWAAGYGFPRFRGGPMWHADQIGLSTLYQGMLKYQGIFGSMHWSPAPLLEELVSKNQTLAEWHATRNQE